MILEIFRGLHSSFNCCFTDIFKSSYHKKTYNHIISYICILISGFYKATGKYGLTIVFMADLNLALYRKNRFKPISIFDSFPVFTIVFEIMVRLTKILEWASMQIFCIFILEQQQITFRNSYRD